jgi:hypothetical protein
MMAPPELDDRLAALAPLIPDAQRAARTRQRCRAALQRRARPHVNTTGLAFRTAAAGAVGLLCFVYVLSLIVTTLSLRVPLPR